MFGTLSERCSAFAAAMIGLSFAGTESQDQLETLFSTAQSMSDTTPQNGTPMNSANSLDLVAGNLLLAYICYGREELSAAQAHLHQSAKMALEAKLDDSLNASDDDILSGMKRSVWFELQVANALLPASTGSRIKPYECSKLSTRPMRPNVPSHLRDRVEAALLLHDCVQTTAVSAQGLQRILHLDHVLLNRITKVQTDWYGTRRRSALARRRADAGIEACLFDTILLLHAGRIQLHRTMWCADVSFDLTLCSLHRHEGHTEDKEELFASATKQRESSFKAISQVCHRS